MTDSASPSAPRERTAVSSSASGSTDFDEVLTAARAGGEWAWARLHAALAPSVAGYLRAHGAAEPEDLVSEVFLQVVRGLDSFSGGEREFRAWVFTIAHRRLVDELRRRGRRPVMAAGEEVTERVGGDVREEAEAALAERAVREAIAELPPDQRAVILLRILGDLTIDEIARAVGKRRGAVKALQRRALKNLGRAYPYEAGER